MTKMFCPVAGCNKSRFASPHPTQQHVNKHLRLVHGLLVTPSNIHYYRRRQNEAYQRRHEIVATQRSRAIKKLREQFASFANDPSQPLPNQSLDECVQRRYVELMDVESDSEGAGDAIRGLVRAGRGAKKQSDWFGKGPVYDVSFRTARMGEALSEREREEGAEGNVVRRRPNEKARVDEKMQK